MEKVQFKNNETDVLTTGDLEHKYVIETKICPNF